MYKISTITSKEQISNGDIALIDIYNWGGEYRPETTAQLCYLKGEGLLLKMVCKESDPLITVRTPVGSVCVDSCMEFFFDLSLEHSASSPYINIEANAAGALCCQIGDKKARVEFAEAKIPLPEIVTYVNEDEWGFTLFISNEILHKVYPDINLDIGSVIHGSFYKCGDHTKTPHYGSYVKIDFPSPSFHQPAFFVPMTIA